MGFPRRAVAYHPESPRRLGFTHPAALPSCFSPAPCLCPGIQPGLRLGEPRSGLHRLGLPQKPSGAAPAPAPVCPPRAPGPGPGPATGQRARPGPPPPPRAGGGGPGAPTGGPGPGEPSFSCRASEASRVWSFATLFTEMSERKMTSEREAEGLPFDLGKAQVDPNSSLGVVLFSPLL